MSGAHFGRAHHFRAGMFEAVGLGPGVFWLVGDGVGGRVLAEEFWVCESGIRELGVVVGGAVEEFAVVVMSLVVVLWALYIEVSEPSQLTIHVSVLLQNAGFGEARPLGLILFEGVNTFDLG
jgi:hypothetical protein